MKPPKIIIIGAGHAGLLAANLLRRHDVEVWEMSLALPKNHGAILRFRTPAVSDALGVPFSKVRVSKAAWKDGEMTNEVTPAMANSYSLRASGEVHNRSVLNLASEDRWLAPDDFTTQLARGVSIEFDSPANHSNLTSNPEITFISTMPMPVLMRTLAWRGKDKEEAIQFRRSSITSYRYYFGLPVCSVVQTIYNCNRPHPSTDGEPDWYRATLEGQTLIIECLGSGPHKIDKSVATQFLRKIFGFGHGPDIEISSETSGQIQQYGKIVPIEERTRRNFISWATSAHRIYSLGRYATWRPSLLLDDLVKDIKMIDRMITSGDSYARTLNIHK